MKPITNTNVYSFEILELDENAIFDFISEKGLIDEYEEWAYKKYKKITGLSKKELEMQ